MTISNEVDHVSYSGNGVTVDYPVPFKVFAAEDLRVILIDEDDVETVQDLDTDYTIDDADLGTATSNITFVTAPPSGTDILIRRHRELDQPTGIRDNSAYNPGAHEEALDAQVMHSQRLAYDLKRCLRVGETEGETVGQLPNATDRANKYLHFDAQGVPEVVTEASVQRPKMWLREGNLTTTDNARFGVWRALENETYTRIDAQLRAAPSGSDVVADLMDQDGNVRGSVTIPAGETYAITTGLNVELSPGDWVHPAITQIGSVDPGASMTFRLLP